jgi:hypothetical protein
VYARILVSTSCCSLKNIFYPANQSKIHQYGKPETRLFGVFFWRLRLQKNTPKPFSVLELNSLCRWIITNVSKSGSKQCSRSC